MLLQSHNGEVHVLPAKPAGWQTGSVTGLKARGNVTVGVSWGSANSVDITAKPANTGNLTLRNGIFTGRYTVTDTTTGQPVTGTADGDRFTFTATAGHTYRAAGSTKSTNLALNASASQSSTEYGGVAGRAVDGVTNGAFWSGSVTHTSEHPVDANPWWQVDLGASHEVSTVRLWNRTDCCADRLRQFYVFASDTPFTSNDPQVTAAQSGVWSRFESTAVSTTLSIPIGRKARYVRVQLTGSDRPLSLAEVQVSG
ncbi:discoidin domain-containing protein [Saccharothrix sp. S26]|uniref:glycoside hydrolase family 95-like protein n=1 Tax=Saccharothrix sp. S26 TaxID=2907215 RepID=UPI001F2DBDED|nr:discoidin domain-containing protein [Saccharothrix sp. S26]MCE6998572.1 discoidin domain-containing protein [Saccharothrix sp. S26]